MQDPAYGYGQSSPQQFSTESTRPSGGRRKRRIGCIIGLVVFVLLLALVGGISVFHYLGPTRTVQAFLDASIVHYDGSSSYALLCPEAQAKVAESQWQSALDTAKSTESAWDISKVTYTLVDEDFFGPAHVRLGGSATATVNGQLETSTFNLPDKDLLTLHSTGLGWCLTDNNLTLSNG